MMTIFKNRIWCVKVDPFVGNWSKRRQTETSTNKTSTNRNTDIPKYRQTKTKAATNKNVDIPKHQQTKASTGRKVDRPKHRQTKTSTNQTKPKRRNTKTSTDQKRWHTKRRQTETWTVQFSTQYSRVFVFIILGMYYIYIHTYVWLVGCTLCISTHNFIIIGVTLHISTSKIKYILGGTPGIILKVKDHFERLTINTDVCTEVV